MTLAILLKTMESLQNGVATHFQLTPLFSNMKRITSIIIELLEVGADAWCKWVLKVSLGGLLGARTVGGDMI